MTSINDSVSSKCVWCGTPVSASDESCPKCGAVLKLGQNAAAEQHASSPIEEAVSKNIVESPQLIVPALDEGVAFERMKAEAMRSLGLNPTFVSNQTLGYIISVCLALYIFLDVLFAVVELLSKSSARGLAPHPPTIDATDLIKFLIIIASGFISLLTAVFFLIWIYRAHKNLSALGATDLRYSPWWAVLGFFIPLLNLVRPYQVVLEIWKSSHPEVRSSYGVVWKEQESSLFISVWWITWIISRTLDSLGAFMVFGASDSQRVAVATRLLFLSGIIGIASAILAMRLVLKINRRQENTNRMNLAQAAQKE